MRKLLAPLGVRLALSFVGVAFAALAVLSALVLESANRNVGQLARQEEGETVEAISHAAGTAYVQAAGWTEADLAGVLTLAADADVAVAVFDASGRRIGGSTTTVRAADTRTAGVQIGGQRVGTVRVGLGRQALPSPERQVRDALVATVAAGAGLAALLAFGVAIAVSRRITRPIVVLTEATRAMERGDRTARLGDLSAPGELSELAAAFDRMAETIAREEGLRQALVADVAHELRTPLTVLRATTEGLVQGFVAATPEQLGAVHDDVLRLEKVLEDLESLASAEAAGLSLQVEEVDLADVVEKAVRVLRPQVEAAGLLLETRLEPTPLRADPRRLHQVVTNLLTNAAKFTPERGTVTVGVRAAEGGAELLVSDSGVGIPPEEVPHVFERFWRGTAAHGIAGSGIGLTVVAELVRAHEGVVQVDSEPGRGTVVRVTLPTGT